MPFCVRFVVVLAVVCSVATAQPLWKDVGPRLPAVGAAKTVPAVLAVSRSANPNSFALASGDLDGDGLQDVALSGLLSRCSWSSYVPSSAVVRQTTVGRFSFVDAAALPSIFATSAYTHMVTARSSLTSEGRNLLYCSSLLSGVPLGAVRLLANESVVDVASSLFPVPLPNGCFSGLLAAADLDGGDGVEEILIDQSILAPAAVSLFRVTANGSYSNVTASYLFPVPQPFRIGHVAFGDIVADGFADFVIFAGLSPVATYLYVNLKNGTLVQTPSNLPNVTMTSSLHGALEVADVNGDGVADVVLSSNASMAVVSYTSWNNGSFSPGLQITNMPILASALLVRDLNVDGRTDIIVVGLRNGSGTGFALMQNLMGSFDEVAMPILLNQDHGALAALDLTSPSYRGFVVVGPSTDTTSRLSYILNDRSDFLDNTATAFGGSNLLHTIVRGSVSTVRFDSDACDDLLFLGFQTDSSGSQSPVTSLLIGDCNGTFAHSSSADLVTPLLIGNALWHGFLSSPKPDLFVSGSDSGFASSFRFYSTFGTAGGLIDQTATAFPSLSLTGTFCSVVICDLSGDGVPEVVVSMDASIAVFSFEANLTFSAYPNVPQPPLYSQQLVISLASTGSPVFLRSLSSSGFLIYTGLANGTLTLRNLSHPDLPSTGVAFAAADVDGDMDVDLFLCGVNSALQFVSVLLLQNGIGLFSFSLNAVNPSAALSEGAAVLADLDMDGDLDLVVTGLRNSTATSLVALQNQGGVFFDPIPDFPTSYGFRASSMTTFSTTLNGPPGVAVIGVTACGYSVFVSNLSTAVTMSSTSTLGGASSGIGDVSSLSESLIAILGGTLGGGFMSLVACFVISGPVVLCCLLCIALVLVLIFCVAVVVILVAVAIGFAIALSGGAVGVVSFLRRGHQPLVTFDIEEYMASMKSSAFASRASEVQNAENIDWADITLIRRLGDVEESTAKVFLATWNGVEVAVKLFHTDEALDEFEVEARMMAKVSHHPGMVNLIGISHCDTGVALVMGLCRGGSLLSALEQHRVIHLVKTGVLLQVACALSFLHSLGVVHRDIAARNVLLDEHGRARLSDFGLSRTLEEGQDVQTTTSYVGPWRWMAPESIERREYSMASDCYSFAMLMFEVWSDGEVPFSTMTTLGDVAVHVVRDDARPEMPVGTPQAHVELAKRLWERDPRNRATMADACRLFAASYVCDTVDSQEVEKLYMYESIESEGHSSSPVESTTSSGTASSPVCGSTPLGSEP
jgi:predicted Ser/Thr protein kinase